jgi:polysaccharide export outer membrane protein
MKTSVVILCLFLAGCGSAYVSPTVQEVAQASAQSAKVQVVRLNVDSVQKANASLYTPKGLPQAFYSIAKATDPNGASNLPDPVVDKKDRPSSVEVRIPPALAKMPYRLGISDVLILASTETTVTVTSTNSGAELGTNGTGPSGISATPSVVPGVKKRVEGYMVQQDGAISVPDIGRVSLVGLTLKEAEAQIFQALIDNQKIPTFSLEISEFNSQRVSVGGAVRSPFLARITVKDLYLDEVLQLAGGVTTRDLDFAVIRLYRDGELYQIPVRELFIDKKIRKIRLKGGDSIYVDTEYDLSLAQAFFTEQITLQGQKRAERSQEIGELQTALNNQRARANEARTNFTSRTALDAVPRDYVYLAGEVARQGRFTMPFGRKPTLADALYTHSGVSTAVGNASQYYILRGNEAGDTVTAFHLDARNAANLTLATRMELRPNDIIFIAEQPVTKWQRTISQMSLLTTAIGLAAR